MHKGILPLGMAIIPFKDKILPLKIKLILLPAVPAD